MPTEPNLFHSNNEIKETKMNNKYLVEKSIKIYQKRPIKNLHGWLLQGIPTPLRSVFSELENIYCKSQDNKAKHTFARLDWLGSIMKELQKSHADLLKSNTPISLSFFVTPYRLANQPKELLEEFSKACINLGTPTYPVAIPAEIYDKAMQYDNLVKAFMHGQVPRQLEETPQKISKNELHELLKGHIDFCKLGVMRFQEIVELYKKHSPEAKVGLINQNRFLFSATYQQFTTYPKSFQKTKTLFFSHIPFDHPIIKKDKNKIYRLPGWEKLALSCLLNDYTLFHTPHDASALHQTVATLDFKKFLRHQYGEGSSIKIKRNHTHPETQFSFTLSLNTADLVKSGYIGSTFLGVDRRYWIEDCLWARKTLHTQKADAIDSTYRVLEFSQGHPTQIIPVRIDIHKNIAEYVLGFGHYLMHFEQPKKLKLFIISVIASNLNKSEYEIIERIKKGSLSYDSVVDFLIKNPLDIYRSANESVEDHIKLIAAISEINNKVFNTLGYVPIHLEENRISHQELAGIYAIPALLGGDLPVPSSKDGLVQTIQEELLIVNELINKQDTRRKYIDDLVARYGKRIVDLIPKDSNPLTCPILISKGAGFYHYIKAFNHVAIDPNSGPDSIANAIAKGYDLDPIETQKNIYSINNKVLCKSDIDWLKRIRYLLE